MQRREFIAGLGSAVAWPGGFLAMPRTRIGRDKVDEDGLGELVLASLPGACEFVFMMYQLTVSS
jgi:hypothetical protein